MSDTGTEAQEHLWNDEELQRTRRTITAVCHDLSNPLSIIGGNAQLLSELAAAMELGDEIRDPIRDIERAVEQVSEQLERLSQLNGRLSVASTGR